MPFLSTRVRLHRWSLLLLAAAVVAAQWLGLVHGLVHGPAVALPRLVAAHPAHLSPVAAPPADAGHAHPSLGDLFADHDEVACRLADAIGHDAAPLIALPTLPVLPPAAVHLRLAGGEACARWAALFDARAPPAAAS